MKNNEHNYEQRQPNYVLRLKDNPRLGKVTFHRKIQLQPKISGVSGGKTILRPMQSIHVIARCIVAVTMIRFGLIVLPPYNKCSPVSRSFPAMGHIRWCPKTNSPFIALPLFGA